MDRYFYLVDLMVSTRQPVLLVGPSGIGKSSLVQVSETRGTHCGPIFFVVVLKLLEAEQIWID